MLRTGQQYLNALNDGRAVWVGNQKIDNVATHPASRDYAARTAEFFDLHNRPDLQDILTFVDESGARRSMAWFQHRSKEQLVRKRRYLEFIMKQFVAASCPRTPDLQTTPLGDLYRRPRAVGSRPRWAPAAAGSPTTSAISGATRWTTIWSSRRISSIRRPTVPTRARTRSRRLCASSRPTTRASSSTASRRSALRRHSRISCTLACSSGPAPKVIRSSTASARRTCPASPSCVRESLVQRDPIEHPLASQGDELDATVLFDNVLIPWKYVSTSATRTTPSSIRSACSTGAIIMRWCARPCVRSFWPDSPS